MESFKKTASQINNLIEKIIIMVTRKLKPKYQIQNMMNLISNSLKNNNIKEKSIIIRKNNIY